MTKDINQTDISVPIVDKDGKPTQAFYQILVSLAELEIIKGDGDPNGQLKAKEKTLYYDTSGVSGSILYIKTTGIDEDLGWVAI